MFLIERRTNVSAGHRFGLGPEGAPRACVRVRVGVILLPAVKPIEKICRSRVPQVLTVEPTQAVRDATRRVLRPPLPVQDASVCVFLLMTLREEDQDITGVTLAGALTPRAADFKF